MYSFTESLGKSLLKLESLGCVNSHDGADDSCHTQDVLFNGKGPRETLLEHAATSEGRW